MAELRGAFHDELLLIREQVVALGRDVVALIPRVTEILLTRDLDGAHAVIQADVRFNEQSMAIEQRALSVLALQAPVARDLREVASAIKLASEMERSADLCRNVCRATRRMYGHPIDEGLNRIIADMGAQATTEYSEALEAYEDHDASRAAALADIDDYLDALHRQFIEHILESNAAGDIDLQVAVQLALVARFYERLGDHAVGVSHKVLYIETGRLPEPSPPNRTIDPT